MTIYIPIYEFIKNLYNDPDYYSKLEFVSDQLDLLDEDMLLIITTSTLYNIRYVSHDSPGRQEQMILIDQVILSKLHRLHSNLIKNLPDHLFEYFLQNAIRKHRIDVVRRLLEYGIDISSIDILDHNPTIEIAKLFGQYGYKIEIPPIYLAIIKGNQIYELKSAFKDQTVFCHDIESMIMTYLNHSN